MQWWKNYYVGERGLERKIKGDELWASGNEGGEGKKGKPTSNKTD